MFNWFKKLIDKIAEANKESFKGGQKLDCCDLNRMTEKNPNNK